MRPGLFARTAWRTLAWPAQTVMRAAGAWPAAQASMSAMALSMGLAVACVMTACSSTPPPPDWRLSAHGALERAVAAYLAGDSRVAEVEFTRSRAEVARTGRPDWVARNELVRCAAERASLVPGPCTGFETLRPDAGPAELAYAAYLDGSPEAGQLALLPPAQQPMARPDTTSARDLAALQATPDPLARLVGAAASLRAGRADAGIVSLAIDTASAQGWRRPLLAWLGLARDRAQRAGEAAEAQRLARRIALVLQGPGTPAP